jgi:hypothetical protein
LKKVTCRNCFARTPVHRRAPFCNAAQGRLLLLYEHFFMFSVTKIREFIETYHEICYFT